MSNIDAYLSEVIEYNELTESEYQSIIPQGLITYPIPFFGDIRSAKVITVGVNPSSGEFAIDRGWLDNIDSVDLEGRLLHYFSGEYAPPHPWFNAWENALNCLNYSYRNGSAAHLDFSFRATYPLSQILDNNVGLFEKMVSSDLMWFLDALDLCKNVKILILAGSVTRSYYLNEFLREYCPHPEFDLTGDINRNGSGWTADHRLIGHGKTYSIFFVSTGPGAHDHGELMINRIRENSVHLQTIIRG